MIPKISTGKSFVGLGQYLLHDAGRAATSERVGFVQTFNLANDDPRAAIEEMRSTAENAELLKAAAGIRAGRANEQVVKHVMLAWHVSESPTKAEQLEAASSYLKALGLGTAQVCIFQHTDTDHAHLHLMISMVNPANGTRFKDGREKVKAQAWALQWEREHGTIYCEQRLTPEEQRQRAPHRHLWTLLRQTEQAYSAYEEARATGASYERGARLEAEGAERSVLRTLQRAQREAFFASGKSAYKAARMSAFYDLRKEMRPEWSAYYRATKSGASTDGIKAMKTGLEEKQAEALRERAEQYCEKLRAMRDQQYRELLDAQKEVRASLQERQGQGVQSTTHLSASIAAIDGWAKRLAGSEGSVLAGATAVRHSRSPDQEREARPMQWARSQKMPAQNRSAMRAFYDRIAKSEQPVATGKTPAELSTLGSLRLRLSNDGLAAKDKSTGGATDKALDR